MHYLVLRLLGRCYVGDFGYIAGERVTNTKVGDTRPIRVSWKVCIQMSLYQFWYVHNIYCLCLHVLCNYL